ncbi:MAG: hypothetical protein F7B18_02845 [Desulfurococcales archaeon]|nr:hypothetical protein [Desulfurococcales archaeon]
MATKRITLRVEVPEGVDKETVERLWKAVLFILASRRLSKLLDEDDAEELARAMEEALWRRLQP